MTVVYDDNVEINYSLLEKLIRLYYRLHSNKKIIVCPQIECTNEIFVFKRWGILGGVVVRFL